MVKTIFIAAKVGDMHAVAVDRILKAKGCDSRRLYLADFPSKQCITFHMKGNTTQIAIDGPEIDFELDLQSKEKKRNSVDVFWDRRPTQPVLPNTLCDADKIIAARECKALVQSVLPLLKQNAFVVNPAGQRLDANCKLNQLYAAKSVGLCTPPSLFSNDPIMIRDFIRHHEERVIHKLAYPAMWRGDGKCYFAVTSIVTADDLPSDEIMRLSPGIFQSLIEKKFEVRVNYMGGFMVATRINSQELSDTATDWRPNQQKISMVPMDLPDSISEKIRALMAQLNLVFGCLDFIVSPGGRYYFLEVNPQGQFLWVEDRTGIPLLDMFSEFLMNGDKGFQWKPRTEAFKLKDIVDDSELETLMKIDYSLHVQPDVSSEATENQAQALKHY